MATRMCVSKHPPCFLGSFSRLTKTCPSSDPVVRTKALKTTFSIWLVAWDRVRGPGHTQDRPAMPRTGGKEEGQEIWRWLYGHRPVRKAIAMQQKNLSSGPRLMTKRMK